MEIKPDPDDPRMLLVDGIKTAQSPNVQEFLFTLPGKELIIEIGTSRGGFSLLLSEYFPESEIHTWDILECENHDRLDNTHINVHTEDCFISQKLKDLMEDNEPKIIFCDGGIKKDEFVRASWSANVGDIICVHDFFYYDHHQDNKLWPTCEASHDMLPRFGVNYIGNEFSEFAVWGMYEKFVPREDAWTQRKLPI